MREREQREGNHFKMYLIPAKDKTPTLNSRVNLFKTTLDYTIGDHFKLTGNTLMNASIQTSIKFVCGK